MSKLTSTQESVLRVLAASAPSEWVDADLFPLGTLNALKRRGLVEMRETSLRTFAHVRHVRLTNEGVQR